MSILTHSPAIVRDGLVLCLDAGAVRSYPGTGPELVSNGNFESSFTNYWVIRPAQDSGNQVLTQDSSIVKSGTYSAKIVVGGSNPNYDGFRGDSSGHFTLTNGKRYLLSFDVYPVNDTGIDAYIVAGSTYCGTNVTGLTQGAWNNVELFIDVTATSSSSFVEFQTGSLWGDGTWYFDNVSVREVLWNDLSGNFNNGTLANAPAFSAESGAGGTKSFDFDGSSDYIDCGTGFNHTSNLTCEMWAKIDTGSGVMFAQWHNASNKRKWYIGMNATNVFFYIDSAGSGTFTSVNGGAYPTDGEWHHYALVYTPSSSLVAYVDGESVGSDTSSVAASIYSSTDVNIYIGRSEAGEYWDGKIAIARMYTKSLTATEIQQNYRTHKGRFGR